MRWELRVASYAVCVRENRVNARPEILLARWVAADGRRLWTLPGGGMEPGEDPYDTVIREVAEETGYEAEPTSLLGTDSIRREHSRMGTRSAFHGLRLVYEAAITGGSLRNEENGSTDLAAWHPVTGIAELPHVELVEVGMRLWRERPAVGRVPRET
ncbi:MULTISPECIES: NUDIX hydrolase [unclassified Streptomyces]|uniref:NUDIX hydrolase n=1 Tax=unclassified Streptomyces TaxID=2593676 RepID=UPI0005BA0996|nr:MULTISPECIES: NUDIX domain-containing protein [unclassified Streptomyces]